MHYFWRRVHWGWKYFYISVGLYLSYVKLYRRNASSTRLIVHQGTRVLIYYDKLAKPKIGTLFCSAAPKQTRRITKPGNPKSLHQYHGKLFSKEEEGPAKTIRVYNSPFPLEGFWTRPFGAAAGTSTPLVRFTRPFRLRSLLRSEVDTRRATRPLRVWTISQPENQNLWSRNCESIS